MHAALQKLLQRVGSGAIQPGIQSYVVTFPAPTYSCADESIDEIAAFLGVGEQVAALTAK